MLVNHRIWSARLGGFNFATIRSYKKPSFHSFRQTSETQALTPHISKSAKKQLESHPPPKVKMPTQNGIERKWYSCSKGCPFFRCSLWFSGSTCFLRLLQNKHLPTKETHKISNQVVFYIHPVGKTCAGQNGSSLQRVRSKTPKKHFFETTTY